ncbi:MAG: single-stranded-DNA-specific exonuclease RecJ [Hyphomicrobiales bacterium]|nr:single-stranded-DNA-specific exonuclease RecJ [Hyphomicrobiales bacterium]
MNGFFLNVERSVNGQAWRPRLDLAGEGQAQAMHQLYGIPDIVARLLAARGVSADGAAAYLEPKLRDLMPDPLRLRDMDRAVARLAQAVVTGEKIAIFGDYDVDGAASSALLAEYVASCGCTHIIHIPDRITEGYGPNPEAIVKVQAEGATLLVTVDCGTTSIDPLALARQIGMDVIVLDHHQAPEVLPDVILVNPNRQDDLSGLGYLCAAGVVHLTLVALHRHLRDYGFWSAQNPGPDLMQGLDLVALATVADVAALVGLNRAYVQRGLEIMRKRERLGLRALMDVARLDGPVNAYHLGFLLGPRINAGGRIGDAALGARLLLETDEDKASASAQQLHVLNEERRVIEAQSVAEAQAEAEASLGTSDNQAVIVTQGAQWHPGIVGLVASRLRETYNRPAFAIAFNGKTGTGSGRSIPGVDLGRAVRAAVETGLLVKGGGHAMAAGITLEIGQLGPFRAWLEHQLAQVVARARANEALYIDAALNAGGATQALYETVERAGPYGAGNPQPIFALPAHRILQATVLKDAHVKITAQAPDRSTIDAIAFRVMDKPLGQALLAARGECLHLAGQLSANHWNGRTKIQLMLKDCARPD